MDTALTIFSARQVKEGLALFTLLRLKPVGPLALLYQLMQLLRPLCRKLIKNWPLPTQTALSQSLKPFSEIVEENDFWVKNSARHSTVVIEPLLPSKA
jgi:hypothetical protein